MQGQTTRNGQADRNSETTAIANQHSLLVAPADDTVDIAALKREIDWLRQQLQQAQKMSTLGSLASSITHEFNNILMTIINYSKLGMRQQQETLRQKAFSQILDAGQRAATITTGILAYARKGSEQREAFDVVPLVEDTLLLVERDLNKHGIKLYKHFDDQARAIINANQIQQVLLNLIINARQASETGGRLLLSVAYSGDRTTVEEGVTDNGAGISPDKLPHIFDPFFSTKSGPDSTGKGGTGLGLSTCRDIIESHQGRIRVESKLGQGTTFVLKLPAA